MVGPSLILGYYGYQNSGDDAFLAVTSWALKNFFHAESLYALTARVPQTYGIPVQGIKLPYPFRGVRLLSELHQRIFLRGLDCIVFGGGSNFRSAWVMRDYLRLINRYRPSLVFAAGVSIGPFEDIAAEEACHELLGKMHFVGLRDYVSADRVKKFNVQNRIEVTFDLAPLLLKVGEEPAPDRERRFLGVCMCPYESVVGKETNCEKDRTEAVVHAIKMSAQTTGIYNVKLIDMNGHKRSGDAAVHDEIAAALGPGFVIKRQNYTESPKEMLSAFRECIAVLTMRLHGAVYAFLTGTPCVFLGYEEKCGEWAKMVNLPEECMHSAYSVTVAELTEKLIHVVHKRTLPKLTVEDAVECSSRNWTWRKND